jgi:hypothetical protein
MYLSLFYTLYPVDLIVSSHGHWYWCTLIYRRQEPPIWPLKRTPRRKLRMAASHRPNAVASRVAVNDMLSIIWARNTILLSYPFLLPRALRLKWSNNSFIQFYCCNIPECSFVSSVFCQANRLLSFQENPYQHWNSCGMHDQTPQSYSDSVEQETPNLSHSQIFSGVLLKALVFYQPTCYP